MLDQKTVRGFIEELGSNSPVPGGGSVAALAASLASGLGSMVFNLTIGKKVFNEYSDEEKILISKTLDACLKYQSKFLELMNKDKEAFLILMSAFKLPKESEDDKKVRSAKIKDGYLGALEVPLIVAEEAYKIYEYVMVAAKLGNKNAISDAGVSVLMLQASIESAILNVKINLSSIKDEIYKEKIKKRCYELVENGRIKRDQILTIVDESL
ncbi:cyclodeaminase/cyclohydrolase family protein [Clostridium estertheticum]|uniref:cyclodeaminase/cyclohydrolase family protein n=1 Tax=Clostridium estertheticum TaxID=238834 RepID=UPI001C0DBBA9|nr:cyclodeaminase/cyclohydrolase family protein [Clostridium estertheticum]MBU3074272.1 cyclodeaminase/cyclohydrolase family protein [Clostridium estertheticum]MBU3164366.1 cyclodeaminase/cyclohydrolase family protein [Clostridium estertheticum]